MTEITNEQQALRDSLVVQSPGEVVDWINALIYGEPGTGKTFLMGTADDSELTKPMLVFDVEGGMTTLRNKPGIDVVSVRSMKDLQDGYNKLYRSIKDGKIYYKTVGIDSLTELADLDLKEIMKAAHSQNPDKIDPDVADLRGWGKVRAHIRTITRAFRDLPCNVIYIASVGEKREEGQPTQVFPGFSGKLRTDIPGFMDIVGYYFVEIDPIRQVVTRKLQVQGTRRVVAKDRTSALGGAIENPTIPMMWEMISKPLAQLEAEKLVVGAVELESPAVASIKENT